MEEASDLAGVDSPSGNRLCIVCQFDFLSLRLLMDHVAERHNYVCQVCEQEYKTASGIQRHCRTEHPDRYSRTVACCPFCPSIFRSAPEKLDHIAKVHDVETSGSTYVAMREQHEYSCLDCSKPYGYSDSLRKHAKLAHGRTLRFCHNCTLSFRTDEEKAAHMAVAHGTRKRQKLADDDDHDNHDQTGSGFLFKCPYCEKSYGQDRCLRKHCTLKHRKPLSICKDCFTTFPGRHARLGHSTNCKAFNVRIETGDDDDESEEEGGYECPSCMMAFREVEGLQQHCRDVHRFKVSVDLDADVDAAAVESYRCPVCLTSYPNARSVRWHCDSKHNLRVAICCSCVLVFTSKELLAAHHRAGCGRPKPQRLLKYFVCPVCQSQMKTADRAHNHVKRHPGWKDSFVCGTCRVVLRTTDEAKVHAEKCNEDVDRPKVEVAAVEEEEGPVRQEAVAQDSAAFESILS